MYKCNLVSSGSFTERTDKLRQFQSSAGLEATVHWAHRQLERRSRILSFYFLFRSYGHPH